MAKIGNIYFLESAGFIKIGFAKDVRARLRGLSTSMPKPGTLIAAVPGSKKFESALHAAASAYHQRGEWFRDCDELRSLIDSVVLNGAMAIGFVEPPETPTHFDCEMALTFKSPLGSAFERVNACLDQYLGPHVTDKKQRRRVGKIISRSLDSLEHLTAPAIASAFDESPINHASLLPKAEQIAARLEVRLRSLSS